MKRSPWLDAAPVPSSGCRRLGAACARGRRQGLACHDGFGPDFDCQAACRDGSGRTRRGPTIAAPARGEGVTIYQMVRGWFCASAAHGGPRSRHRRERADRRLACRSRGHARHIRSGTLPAKRRAIYLQTGKQYVASLQHMQAVVPLHSRRSHLRGKLQMQWPRRWQRRCQAAGPTLTPNDCTSNNLGVTGHGIVAVDWATRRSRPTWGTAWTVPRLPCPATAWLRCGGARHRLASPS